MCCGVDRSSDWSMFTPFYGEGQTPDSCCFAYNVGCGGDPAEEKWYMVSIDKTAPPHAYVALHIGPLFLWWCFTLQINVNEYNGYRNFPD